MLVCFNPRPDDNFFMRMFYDEQKESVYKPFVPIWYEDVKIELWQNESEQTR